MKYLFCARPINCFRRLPFYYEFFIAVALVFMSSCYCYALVLWMSYRRFSVLVMRPRRHELFVFVQVLLFFFALPTLVYLFRVYSTIVIFTNNEINSPHAYDFNTYSCAFESLYRWIYYYRIILFWKTIAIVCRTVFFFSPRLVSNTYYNIANPVRRRFRSSVTAIRDDVL